MIKLGTIVKDRVTGFSGVVVGITEWLNGCRRIGIQAQKIIAATGVPSDIHWIDEVQLNEAPTAKAYLIAKKVTSKGGPTPAPIRNVDDRGTR